MDRIEFDQYHVWGIWSPRKLKTLYQMMAVELRVPISVLVCHILNSWAIENGQTMLQDDKQRQGFGEYLAKQRKADLERRKT